MLSDAFLPFPLDGSATLHRVFTVPWLGHDVIITPTSRVGGRVRVLGSGVFDFSLHNGKLRIVPDRTLRRGADFTPADTDALGRTRQLLKCSRDHMPYEPHRDDNQHSGAGIPDVLATDTACPIGTVSLADHWGDADTGECHEVMLTLHSGQTLLALQWKGPFDELPSIFLPTGEMLYDGQRNETDLSLLLVDNLPRLGVFSALRVQNGAVRFGLLRYGGLWFSSTVLLRYWHYASRRVHSEKLSGSARPERLPARPGSSGPGQPGHGLCPGTGQRVPR
jgi:hypothetical protein